ncbi:MAG: hypothetical protein WKG01_29265 [Kofleriaceae bacterium]
MFRSILIATFATACVSESPSEPTSELEVTAVSQGLSVSDVTRVQIAGDVYHYGFVVRVGDGPNAVLHLHRVVREKAPWIPRKSTGAILLMHGDFANFDTNFAPSSDGLAPWLAEHDVDVWGIDRRFTQAPEDGDLSDFDAMGIDQELEDIQTALAFARGIRLVTDRSTDRITLSGFSRGGALAYFYAAREATRPVLQRHIKGLVPLDVYASLGPADEDIRQWFCQTAADEYSYLAAGWVEVSNAFQFLVGQWALDDPEAENPWFAPLTNRETMLMLVGTTFQFFPASPNYHLNGAVFDGDKPVGLRSASETVIATWLANAPAYASMRESADTDQLTCGTGPLPADLPLSRIQVPLFLIAAAGGYGERAIFSTTQVSSTDVSTLVVRQLPVERELEDFGHADLLFSPDAEALAWQPLLAWLRAH